MAAQLEATVTSTNQRLGYTGALRSLPPIAMDYIPPGVHAPLELMLVSLGTCSGGTIGYLLRKMGKTVTSIKVNAKGTRREQHPTRFQTILFEFIVSLGDVRDADMKKAIQLAEESVCPVWAMVKGNVEVKTEYKIAVS